MVDINSKTKIVNIVVSTSLGQKIPLERLIMDLPRPLDTLNKARNKKVIVELKNNKQFIGELKAFDIHINVVLENAEERVDNEVKRKLGSVFIRGDTITIISTTE